MDDTHMYSTYYVECILCIVHIVDVEIALADKT